LIIVDEYRERCKNFTIKVIKTNLDEYKRRGQTNVDRIKKQIFIGKLAECAVWKVKKDELVSGPDFTIYPPRHKSFDADLMFKDGKELHVKCQYTGKPGNKNNSWVFQKVDNPKGYIILTTYYKKHIYIEKMIRAEDADYSDTRLMLPTKKALYMYDLR